MMDIQAFAAGVHSMEIEYNPHKQTYQSAKDYLELMSELDIAGIDDGIDGKDWNQMIESETIWRINVYPSTPIGFYVIMSSTLEKAWELLTKGE